MIWVKLGGKIIQIAKKQLDKWLSKGAKIVKEPKKETTKAVDKSPNPTELFNKFRKTGHLRQTVCSPDDSPNGVSALFISTIVDGITPVTSCVT